jgi:FAD:protein FMN transferase
MTRLSDRTFRAMGTSCRVAATVPDDLRGASGAHEKALGEIARCERVLTRFEPSSDLSRVNARAGEWVVVDPVLLDALARALDARDATGGLFDPTVLPALIAAGYDRSFERLTLEHGLPHRPDDWRAGARVEIDVDRRRVRVERGSAIDLGGIGKGFSAMRAVRAMREAQPALAGCLVDLGGDIAFAGEPPGGGSWRVSIADPRDPSASLDVLSLEAGKHAGVATSGRDRRRFGPDAMLHHLIDPATGAPAVPGPLTVTVVAATAVEAETHATALAILPTAQAPSYVAERPGLSALLVPHAGPVLRLGELPVVRRHTLRVTVAA